MSLCLQTDGAGVREGRGKVSRVWLMQETAERCSVGPAGRRKGKTGVGRHLAFAFSVAEDGQGRLGSDSGLPFQKKFYSYHQYYFLFPFVWSHFTDNCTNLWSASVIIQYMCLVCNDQIMVVTISVSLNIFKVVVST